MKDIYKYSLAVVIFILLVVCVTTIFSYAFIGTANNSGVTNANTTITNPGTGGINMTYTTSAINLAIDPDLLSSENANNGYTSYISSTGTMTMTLTYPSSFANGVKCTYDIIYTPSVKYTASSGIGSLHELTIAGSNGTDSFSEVVLDNVSSAITLASNKVMSASSSGSLLTWTFTMKFYNLNIDQTSALGQSPSGTLSIYTKTCGGR